MKDIFHDYMSKRLDDLHLHEVKTEPGPVVSISRAAGCSVRRMARKLAEQLSELDRNSHWSMISKEVLHESAGKLKLQPKKIKSVFKVPDRSVFEDVLEAFLSKDYHLERKMRNTVIKVIRQFAIDGHKVFVGRGANSICSDINQAIHIRVEAPLEWRIKKVMHNRNYTREKAVQCIVQTEKDRTNFRKSIRGNKNKDEYFDLIINQECFSNDEIIALIIEAMKLKKLI